MQESENQPTNPTIIIKEEDFQQKVIIDLRGTKKTYYVSTILQTGSNVLIELIGKGSFGGEPTNKQQDGSYFIDCEPDIFVNMVEYALHEHLPKLGKYNSKYLTIIFSKFGIKLKTYSKVSINEKKLKQFNEKKLEQFNEQKKIFLEELQRYVNEQLSSEPSDYIFRLTIVDGIEKKVISKNNIICFIFPKWFYNSLCPIIRTEELCEDFFKTIQKEGYIKIIELFFNHEFSLSLDLKFTKIDGTENLDEVETIINKMYLKEINKKKNIFPRKK